MSLWDTKISKDPTMQGHTLPQAIIDMANECKTFKGLTFTNYDPKDKDADTIDIEAQASKPETLPLFAVVQVNGINAYYKINDDISFMVYTEANFPVTLDCEAYGCTYDPSAKGLTNKQKIIIGVVIVFILCCCCCCCYFLTRR
jgi:hypothetical protein